MKLELLFAAALLALGCLLWNSQSFPGFLVQNTTESRQTQLGEFISEKGKGSGWGIQHTLTSADQNVENVQAGNQLLAQSAYNLGHSVSVTANVRITMRMFDEDVVAEGVYYQLGGGRRHARLDFVVQTEDGPLKVSQVCDGRFHYVVTQSDIEKKIEIVDLERIAQTNGAGEDVLGKPVDVLATGSVLSMLQNLASSFSFGPAEAIELGGIPMWGMSGTWNREPLKSLTLNITDPANLEPEIKWGALPPQIPHAVHVTLGKDEFFPLFPYRVQFFKYSEESKSFTQPMLMLELYEVTKVANMDFEVFHVDSNNADQIEATERYVARVMELQQHQAAQKQTPQTASSLFNTTQQR